MTRFITIASAKGGTGKTTTSINVGLALTKLGYDALVVDANLETPHIGLHLGNALVKNTIHDALKGKKPIRQTAYLHNSGLRIIPGRLNEEEISCERLGEELESLFGTSSLVLIDTAAGLGDDVQQALAISDDVVIVTNPDIVSVTDAMKTVAKAKKLGKNVKGIVVNKVTGGKHELSRENIQQLLDAPILSNVPFDNSMAEALRKNQPLNILAPHSKTAKEFKKIALQLLQ